MRKNGVSSFFWEEKWCQFIFLEEKWCRFIFLDSGENRWQDSWAGKMGKMGKNGVRKMVSVHFSGLWRGINGVSSFFRCPPAEK